MTKGNRISFAVFCFDWSAQYPHCKQSTQFLFFIWSPHFSHPSLRLTSVDHCRCEFGLYSIYSIASALSFAYACIHQLLNVRRQSEHFQFIQIETYRCWCVRAQMCVLHLWKVFGTRRWCESWSFNLDSFFFFSILCWFFSLARGRNAWQASTQMISILHERKWPTRTFFFSLTPRLRLE